MVRYFTNSPHHLNLPQHRSTFLPSNSLIIFFRSIRIWTTKIRSIDHFFLIVFERFLAITCVMISHFAISTFDLIAIRWSFKWLMKIKIFSISISISFSKFFSITTFVSIIVLNRFLWCVNNVEAIAFIKLKTMYFEIIDHFLLDFFDVFWNELDFLD